MPKLHSMQGEIATFDYADLPAISKAEVSVLRKFLNFDIKAHDFNSLLSRALGSIHTLEPGEINLECHSFSNVKEEDALSNLSSDFLCVFGKINNPDTPFAIAVNKQAAINLVYLILSSNANSTTEKSELTPFEEGVFSFILSLVYEEMQKSFLNGFSATLETFSKSVNFENFFHSASLLSRFLFEIKVNHHKSLLNIYLPTAGLSALLSVNKEPQNAFFSDGLWRARELKIPLRACVAKMEITKDQLSHLEVGDVIVFDSSEIQMRDNQLLGRIECSLGESLAAKMSAYISTSTAGNYLLKF